MKHIWTILFALSFLLGACASSQPAATPTQAAAAVTQPAAAVLKVDQGTKVKTYTADALKALGAAKASFKGVEYVGVPLSVVLKDAGIDPASLSAVKAVASDGFTANYDASVFNKADTLVGYARSDGPLAANEGSFVVVVPAGDGKLNPRMVVEIKALP